MRSTNRAAIISIIRKEMPYLRLRFGVEQLALFGSYARDEADDNSDVDILVTLSRPLGFGFMELANYLEDKLDRKVDLITANTLETGINDPRRAHIAKDIRESLIHV